MSKPHLSQMPISIYLPWAHGNLPNSSLSKSFSLVLAVQNPVVKCLLFIGDTDSLPLSVPPGNFQIKEKRNVFPGRLFPHLNQEQAYPQQLFRNLLHACSSQLGRCYWILAKRHSSGLGINAQNFRVQKAQDQCVHGGQVEGFLTCSALTALQPNLILGSILNTDWRLC